MQRIKIFITLIWIFSVSISCNNSRTELPDSLIGYSVLQTNLPGGRQANIYTERAVIIKPDGTGYLEIAKELTREPNTWTQFSGWSPDGEIAILGKFWKNPECVQREEETKQLHQEGCELCDTYFVHLKSGEITNITAVERVSHFNTGVFFWPNEPTTIGFTALINGISHPFKMDVDGRNKIDLTNGSKGFTYGLNASPDGKRIAYHKDYQIYIADADGANAIHINSGQPFNFMPDWSPDGKLALFLAGESNHNCNIYLVRADGSGLKKLAERGGYKGAIEFLDVYDFHEGSSDTPVWSVDGKSIFYTAKVGKKVEMFQTNLEGQTEQLTSSVGGTLHYHPTPSPDGKWLLYGSKREGVRQLFVMQLSNHREHQITNLKPGYAAMWAYWQP